MDEIEIKILDIDLYEIQRKLCDLGAKKVFEGRVDAIYLDDGSLGKKKVLRLRKLGDKVQLTYKEDVSRDKFKIAKEEETYLDNFDDALKHFKSIGFKIKKKSNKYRISYHLKNVKFEIDQCKGIPPFLEIESDKKSIEKYVKLLGFKVKDMKPWTVKDVFLHYGIVKE